jgi:predicted transcriptional regulator of viral defense system
LKISFDGPKEIRTLLAQAPEIFTNKQAQEILFLPSDATNRKLARWAKSGYIRRIRKGIYLQVPSYIEKPQEWLGDEYKLALNIWPNSYFTGWTSANHWGLTEQVFRTIVLVTSDRVRTENKSIVVTKFLIKRIRELDLSWGIAHEWRDGFKISIANPSRTIMDVLAYPELGGGIQLGAEFLKAYIDDFDIRELVQDASKHASGSSLKRLGYLLELHGYRHKADLDELSEKISKGVVPLDPLRVHSGYRIMKWNILVNTKIETNQRS